MTMQTPPQPRTMRESLERLCRRHFADEDEIELLREQLTALRDHEAALLRERASAALYPSQGCVSYQAPAGRGRGVPGDPTARVAEAHWREVEAIDRDVAAVKIDINRREQRQAVLILAVLPFRRALAKLGSPDREIILMRYGQLHCGRKPSYERIAEQVGLDESTVRDRLSMLGMTLPALLFQSSPGKAAGCE